MGREKRKQTECCKGTSQAKQYKEGGTSWGDRKSQNTTDSENDIDSKERYYR